MEAPARNTCIYSQRDVERDAERERKRERENYVCEMCACGLIKSRDKKGGESSAL